MRTLAVYANNCVFNQCFIQLHCFKYYYFLVFFMYNSMWYALCDLKNITQVFLIISIVFKSIKCERNLRNTPKTHHQMTVNVVFIVL